MAKTTNLGALGRMGTIEPVTVRDHSSFMGAGAHLTSGSNKLRSASIEASGAAGQSTSANSLVCCSFFADQAGGGDPLESSAGGRRLAALARTSQLQRNDDSSEGGQNSPDYLSSGSSSNALETPGCALKPSASTSCLLTTEESNSSNTLVCIPTRASLTHEWKRLKTPNKCRECNLLVYFNGRECSFCGFVAHKKCVTILVIKCSGQQVCGSKSKQRELARQQQKGGAGSGKPVAQPIFGQPIHENGPKVVDFVKRFIYEIDTRGLTSRGIYRVSSIKSKVDRLCNYYDQNISSLVDLSSFHPNIIANALKMFLRQLPEPLLTQQLYTDFIDVAKKYPKAKSPPSTHNEQPSPSTARPQQQQQQQDSGGNCIATSKTSSSTSYLSAKMKRSLVATQLESPATNQRRDYDPMLIVELTEIIELLPPENLQVIALLMRHLKRVADMSEENQMSATNLSIIFGPTLLSNADNKSLAIVDNIHQARAIELLILWADKIFPQFDNYESKAVIELDFTELELQERERQQKERERLAAAAYQMQLFKAHEKEAKKRGQTKCNCPHHINSRSEYADSSPPLPSTSTNNNDDNTDKTSQKLQDQWPKTRTELMELRRQFFTLPTSTQTDVEQAPQTKTTITSPNIANDSRHRTSGAGSDTGNGSGKYTSNNNSRRGSPNLPMIKVQSHDPANNDSNIRLFKRS